MSEKYDGVRAMWDGTRFLSRNSNLLHIPQSISSLMPNDTTLDGELWFGRGSISECMSIVHKARHVNWDNLKYMVFDAPKQPGVFEGNVVPSSFSSRRKL